MDEKLKLVKKIFSEVREEESPDVPENVPIQSGKYYGGVYNGRKYMYSIGMIEKMSIEKLEAFIRKQIS